MTAPASPPAPGTAPQVAKGLDSVIADETRISEVDGQRCELIYQGYHLDELVGKASYEEVSYLLLYGALPTRQQLAGWTAQLNTHRSLQPEMVAALTQFPRTARPMAALRTAVSLLGLYDTEADEEPVEVFYRKAVNAIAKTPTIVAAIGRLRQGQPPVAPQPELSHAANFLHMLHGCAPSVEQGQALDAYFVLLADHGFNASTFTARAVASTKSDYYSAVCAAVGSLKGPLHGAANRKAMEMLEEIGAPEKVEPYVQKTVADHKRFMGFGHRVYKGPDPRAKHLKEYARRLGEHRGEMKWFAISERLQEAVWNAKKLYINVDFYSASLLHYLDIPTELFTTMFACARIAGWSAHIIEQAANNRLIRPLALYTGPRNLRFVPIDQRPS
ncbi:MAG: citrate synthase [Candidatus Omnitrophica bacterium]|nr:citrate synthase [Candidatus Omnitrophota bacterium]